MVTKDRYFDILDYIIRDYITTAQPVSSGRIHKKIRGSMSPATIRNVMGDLSEEGYLEQPHTSAGRIPTDKAYRYFVDSLWKEEFFMKKKSTFTVEEKHAPDFVQALSEELGMCTMFASHPDEIFWAGMEEMCDEPEFQEHDIARAFVSLIENTPRRIEYYFEEYEGPVPHVLIGHENPFPEAVHFSSVIGRLNKSSIVVTLGPKRMDYERVAAIIRKLLI